MTHVIKLDDSGRVLMELLFFQHRHSEQTQVKDIWL